MEVRSCIHCGRMTAYRKQVDSGTVIGLFILLLLPAVMFTVISSPDVIGALRNPEPAFALTGAFRGINLVFLTGLAYGSILFTIGALWVIVFTPVSCTICGTPKPAVVTGWSGGAIDKLIERFGKRRLRQFFVAIGLVIILAIVARGLFKSPYGRRARSWANYYIGNTATHSPRPASRAVKKPQTVPPTTETETPRPALIVGGNPACQADERKARSDLLAELEKRHPNAYSLQKTLLDTGLKDYRKLCQVPRGTRSDGVLRDLTERHYPSFSLIWMLYETNMEDYEKLR